MFKHLYQMRFYIQEKSPWLYKNIRKIASFYFEIKSKEKKKRYGAKNPDRTIYIVRIRREKLGLMALYITTLAHIYYAKEKGYDVVVDLQNYPNTYLDPEQLHKINAWEYYFEQPSHISLDEAYESKNVILSCMEAPDASKPRYMYFNCICGNESAKWIKVARDYIRLNAKTKKLCEEKFNEVIGDKISNRILGVVCRGTDMLNFTDHSKQPTIDIQIKKIQELMRKYGCKYVYVASDSDKAINKIKDALGAEFVLCTDQKRFDCFSESHAKVLSDIHFDRDNDSYIKGLEYLQSIYILSRCNVLYGSLVGGTLGAMYLASSGENHVGYEHIEIFDEGLY